MYNELRKQGSADAYEQKSNNVDYGSEPKVIETYGRQELFSTNHHSGNEYARRRETAYAKLSNQISKDSPNGNHLRSVNRLTDTQETNILDEAIKKFKNQYSKKTVSNNDTIIEKIHKSLETVKYDIVTDNTILKEILEKHESQLNHISELNNTNRNNLIPTLAHDILGSFISEKNV